MSHSCDTDVVPYIKRHVFEKSDCIYNDPIYSILLIPEAVVAIQCDWQTNGSIPDMKMYGWEFVADKFIGKNKRLAVNEWKKDNIKVYLLNESQYSNAGVFSVSVIADKKEHIEEFVKDFSELISNDFKTKGPNESAQWWA